MSEAPLRHPPLSLDYLALLTDDTGIIQHALYAVPNRPTGYTTDDNARALVVAAQEHERTGDRRALCLATLYLAYLYHALTPDSFFHNLMSYDRRWIDARGSEDSHGRALWSVGYLSAARPPVPADVRQAARQVFEDAVPWARSLRSLRAMAFSLLGIYHYLRGDSNSAVVAGLPERLGNQLLAAFERNQSREWPWFEPILTYSNAMLPNALLLAYELTGDDRYRDRAQVALEFLAQVTLVDGIFMPVGCHGWYARGGTRAWFDQQPIDVGGMVMACLNAARVLKEDRYRGLARTCFEWFCGRNALGRCMVNAETGGCYDGLTPEGVNGNQGAESQTAYLLAYEAAVAADLV
ncbi:MAG: glycosyltransferase [Armatimonadetes bacterium]|nr:glycosyltransferase [Armatimonadota bacterium]